VSTGGTYEVRIKSSAEREMNSLPSRIFERVSHAILRLESLPRPRGCVKLRGREEYRLRIGVYRVLYTVDDQTRVVEIVAVRHRRESYRG
jgi:mRNA interferase RelE/StbE